MGWMVSHAMMPCVYHLEGNIFRVYFSPRDRYNQSRPASFDLNITQPFKKFNLTSKPLLELGQLGAYDDSGVMPTCVVNINNKKHMFFNGWSLGKKIPFFSFNGIAVEIAEGKFEKMANFPNALNRSESDPYSTFAPFVLKDNEVWRMWYVSLVRWNEDGKHFYHIKYAESDNGLNWFPTGRVCIDFLNESEYALGRPVVLKDNTYRMWFSSRALNGIDAYRIRYAESKDGLQWERKDEEAGIDVSESGWDSEMICYPHVFEHNGEKYMLYNGNSYGKSGIGLAVLAREE